MAVSWIDPAGGARNSIHGMIYLDATGEAHFDCTTPAGMTFAAARAGLVKFVALLTRQLDDEKQCPHHPTRNAP